MFSTCVPTVHGRADVPLSARDCRSGPAASGTDVARLVSHTSAREILQALGGELAVQQAGGLADLDEVSIRVPHVAADLRAAVDRRRHELCPLRLPLFVAGLDVSDPQVQEDRSGVAGLVVDHRNAWL